MSIPFQNIRRLTLSSPEQERAIAENFRVAESALGSESVNISSVSSANVSMSTNVSAADSKAVSSGLNTPHDYTVGTWTPSVGGNATYTTQHGFYTRVGRLVSLEGRLTINVLGTGSTGVISGLPVAAAVESAGVVSFWNNLAASYVFVGCYIPAGGLSLVHFSGATTASAALTPNIALFQNGSDVFFHILYHV